MLSAILVTTMMLRTALSYSSYGPVFYIEVKPFVALCLIDWLGIGIVKTSLNKGHATLMIHEHNSLLLRSVYSAQAFMEFSESALLVQCTVYWAATCTGSLSSPTDLRT